MSCQFYYFVASVLSLTGGSCCGSGCCCMYAINTKEPTFYYYFCVAVMCSILLGGLTSNASIIPLDDLLVKTLCFHHVSLFLSFYVELVMKAYNIITFLLF